MSASMCWVIVEDAQGLAEGATVTAELVAGPEPGQVPEGSVIVTRRGTVGAALQLEACDVVSPAGSWWRLTSCGQTWNRRTSSSNPGSVTVPIPVGDLTVVAPGAPPPSFTPVPDGGVDGQVLGHVSGSPAWTNSGGGSGTVDSVVAGANVTVNATDPANPIVSAFIPAAPVTSVNAKTGVVVLDAADVGAATTAQGATADSAVQPGDLGTAAPLDVPASGDATAGQVVKGSDSRLTDARTPTAHAASHATGGLDAVSPASIGALSATAPVLADIPDPTTGAAGQVWTTDSVNGSWATPAGGGMSIQTWNLGDGSVIAPNGSPFTWSNCGTVTTIWINGFFTLAPITVSAFSLSMYTPGDGSAIWVGAIYAANAQGKPGALLWQSPAQDATVGGVGSRQTVSVSPTVTLQPGLYWLAIGVSGWTSTHPSPNKTVGPTSVSVQSSWNSWSVAQEARSTVWNGTFSGTFPATASTSIAASPPPSPWIGLTVSYA